MSKLPDDFPGDQVFRQMLDLFVKPEVERRAEQGLVEKPLQLRAFQVILRDDGPPTVRLNQEVQAIAQVKLARSRDIAVGDPVYAADIGDLESIELTPDEDPNCAHVTCWIVDGTIRVAFDFRYNKGLATRHLDTAGEFLETARDSLAKGRLTAFADSLLSAAELTARAILLTMPDKRFRKKASHKEIQKRHSDFVAIGNADPEHATVYGELRQLRDARRYVTADRELSNERALEYLGTVEDMYRDARERVG